MTANGKFHLVRAGNQTSKFVDGPDFFLLAQLGIEANTIGMFHSNPSSSS